MNPLILQSDFGYADGAVSAMYGVALGVSPTLRVFDLTHDIPQYDIWEASYRLIQTVSYWPHTAQHCGAHSRRAVHHHAGQRHPDPHQADVRH